ncbi:MAG: hypothetical protein P1P90_03320 [Patescibacteria group bacterium]|nr:hypothetical protein [Patescibacteria group bacterium]
MSLKDFQDARLMGSDSVVWSEHYRQARILWDKGFGKALGYDDFEHYLASIPPIGTSLFLPNEAFPHLVLVEGRLDIRRAVDFSGVSPITWNHPDGRTVHEYPEGPPRFPKKTNSGVRWMRCSCDIETWELNFSEYSGGFFNRTIGLDAVEGIAFYVQHPHIFKQIRVGFMNSTRDPSHFYYLKEEQQNIIVGFDDIDFKTLTRFPVRPTGNSWL